MEHFTYNFSFDNLPPVFKRGRTVALAIFQNGKILLARKPVYPENVYRFFGGGVEPDEMLTIAALRELEEETGLKLGPNKVNRWANFQYQITETSSQQQYPYSIDLFYIDAERMEIKPGDDVVEMASFDRDGLANQITLMKSIPADLQASTTNGYVFNWTDWGQVFSLVHEFIYTHWPSSSSSR